MSLAKPTQVPQREASAPVVPTIGTWYYVTFKGKKPWLACVTHLGSNYVAFEGPSTDTDWAGSRSTARVHLDDFETVCAYVPDADAIIGAHIDTHHEAVKALMGEVKALTTSLSVPIRGTLNATSETQALALRDGSQPVEAYKKALAKAEKKTLPALFEKIKNEHKWLSTWMEAKLIPMEAQADALEPVMGAVRARIFNVELYAGLVEHVKQVAEGEPAPVGEKIHLLQRRAYMDEECLIDYRTGGMDFESIGAFDAWLAEPAHRDRILPFPRCVIAFQVRRRGKEREFTSISEWINFHLNGYDDCDKWTFLYMRNGANLFRLDTSIEFDDKLFPDLDRQQLTGGQIYATKDGAKLITQSTYEDMVAAEAAAAEANKKKYQADMVEYRRKIEAQRPAQEAYRVALADYEAKKKAFIEAEQAKDPDQDEWMIEDKFNRTADIEKPEQPEHIPEPYEKGHSRESENYEPWNDANVHYDDIAAGIKAQVDHHNRVALLLQGVLDRSPVFQPHPPWQLWTPEGFAAALELNFDADRALTPGDAPDFEAYRARLNALLRDGSVTVGQDDAWARHMAARYNERYRNGDRMDKTWYRPYGNPVPGQLARVARYGRGRATFIWTRDRLTHNRWGPRGPLPCRFVCAANQLFNCDAYQPGDYRQFFADPRTRADYLKWAPLLLEAEEYKAGHRSVAGKVVDSTGDPD